MPNIQPVTRARYATQRWMRSTHYGFAAADALCPLVLQELPKAVMHMPIAFVPGNGSYALMAIQGLRPGHNHFLDRDKRWLGAYVPAAYRSYPFLMATAQDSRQVLCFDEDSGLLSSTADGEPFFGEDAQPAPAAAEVLDFLNRIAANRVATLRMCEVLQKHKLIQPWPISLHTAAGEQATEGLFRVDEAALNRLPADTLLELRIAGALLSAYCQLLSMQHIPLLGQLADARAKADAQAASQAAAAPLPVRGKELDLSFLEGSETLKFF